MNVGDRVKIVTPRSVHYNKYGTIVFIMPYSVCIRLDGTNKNITYDKTSIKVIGNDKERCLMGELKKLSGFTRVAIITMSNIDYGYALYDNVIRVGDNVLVTGKASNKILLINEIITPEEFTKRTDKCITEEVICKVDLSAYNQRIENRKKAADLRKQMDRKIAEMDEMNKYTMYAERNPELAKMLAEYRELV